MPGFDENVLKILKKYSEINDISQSNAKNYLLFLKRDVGVFEPFMLKSSTIIKSWTLILRTIEQEGIDKYKFSEDEKTFLILINKINQLPELNLKNLAENISSIISSSKMPVPSNDELEKKIFNVSSSLNALQANFSKLKGLADAYVASLEGMKQEEQKIVQEPKIVPAPTPSTKVADQKQESKGTLSTVSALDKERQLQNENEAVKRDLEAKITASQAALARAQEELAQKMAEIERQKAEIERRQAEMEKQQREVNALQRELHTTKQELHNTKQEQETERKRFDDMVGTSRTRVSDLEETNKKLQVVTMQSQEQVTELKKVITVQDGVIAEQTKTITEKDEEIAKRGKVIEKKDERIAALEQELEKQAKLIAEQNKKITEQNESQTAQNIPQATVQNMETTTTQSVATTSHALFPAPSEIKIADRIRDNDPLRIKLVALTESFVTITDIVDKHVITVSDDRKQKIKAFKTVLGEVENHVNIKPLNHEQKQGIEKLLADYYQFLLGLATDLKLPDAQKNEIQQLSKYFLPADVQSSPNKGI